MDHIRISGIEPSSVVLDQTKLFKKMKSDASKVPNQAKAKRDGVLNTENYNFNQFLPRKFGAIKRYKSTKVGRRTWLPVPSGTLCSTSSDTHQVVEILKRLLLRCIHHFNWI